MRPRRGEDGPRDTVAVMMGEQLGHGATHRIPRDDRTVDPELVEHRHGVADGVAEPEPAIGPDAAAVTPLVVGDDVEAFRQRSVDAKPVERGGHRPAVQEQDRRRAGRALDAAELGGAAPGEVQLVADREFGTPDLAVAGNELGGCGEGGHGEESRRRPAASRSRGP